MRSHAILFVPALLLASAAHSQSYPSPRDSPENATLHGSLLLEPGTDVANLTVEISSLRGSGVQQTIGSSSGEFEFTDIPKGEYRIRVINSLGKLIADQLATVRESIETVRVFLRETKIQAPSAGTVSLAQLMHKVPPRAEKEALSAQKAWKKGDMTACIDHLQQAIAIDPEYLDARNDLAIAYMRLDQPENVISAFEEVLKIDPHDAEAYSLISASQAKLEHWTEAEMGARRALGMDPINARSRYVLGLSLAVQKKNDAEALRYLRQSFDAFPVAHMVAAHVLARQGLKGEARAQLETFFPVATTAQRGEIQDWMARLNH